MVAGDADNRPVGGQGRQLSVELVDRPLLLLRVLRVARLVHSLVVHVDEGVARVEPLNEETEIELRFDRFQADAAPETADRVLGDRTWPQLLCYRIRIGIK